MANTVISTGYTGVSRPGQQNLSGDALALFLTKAGDMVLQAWEQTTVFDKHLMSMTVMGAKAHKFPIIGRKREAEYHTVGNLITGGVVEHNEVTISVDNPLFDSVFVAEIDELMNYFEVQAAYSRQIGESIALKFDAYAAQLTILAARNTTPPFTNGPIGKQVDTDRTSSTSLVDAAFAAAIHIGENDIGGGDPKYFVRSAEYYLLVQDEKVLDKDYSGSANISKGTIQEVAGLEIVHVKGNRIPSTNLSADSSIPSKYRVDARETLGLISNPQAVGCLNARAMRLTLDQQNDRLGWLMIGSKVSGLGQLRSECAIEVYDSTIVA